MDQVTKKFRIDIKSLSPGDCIVAGDRLYMLTSFIVHDNGDIRISWLSPKGYITSSGNIGDTVRIEAVIGSTHG